MLSVDEENGSAVIREASAIKIPAKSESTVMVTMYWGGLMQIKRRRDHKTTRQLWPGRITELLQQPGVLQLLVLNFSKKCMVLNRHKIIAIWSNLTSPFDNAQREEENRTRADGELDEDWKRVKKVMEINHWRRCGMQKDRHEGVEL